MDTNFWIDALPVFGGLGWLTAYILIIRQSRIDGVHAMPMVAACSNISWEFWAMMRDGFFTPEMRLINGLWLGLDLIIITQVFVYFPRAFPAIRASISRAMMALTLIACFTLTALLFEEGLRISDTAAFQTTLMSALFLQLLWIRKSTRGQHVAIAWSKGIGTAAIWLWMYILADGELGGVLLGLFILSSALDLLYIALLHMARSARALFVEGPSGAAPS